MLVGDLTALPAMARILESTDVPTQVWAEVPDDLAGYLPARRRRSPGSTSPATGRAPWPRSST